MQPKPITAQGIMYQPEVFLLIAGLLALIAGVAGAAVNNVIIGLIMLGSAAISLGFVEVSLPLKSMLSFLTVSATFGIVLLLGAIQLLVTNGIGLAGWPTLVTLVSSLLSLFAAFRAMVLKKY